MKKDVEDEIAEQLTNEKLEALTKYVSDKYSDFMKLDWTDAAVAEALIEKTRTFLLMDAGITDSETVMNCDLSPLVEELGKTSMLPNNVLHALKRGVALDYAARGPEDVLPGAPEL